MAPFFSVIATVTGLLLAPSLDPPEPASPHPASDRPTNIIAASSVDLRAEPDTSTS
jgi:hypothetical protein